MFRKLTLAVLLIAAICGGAFAYLFVYAPEELPWEVYLETAIRVEQAQDLIEHVLPACTPASAKRIDISAPPPTTDYEQEAKVAVVPASVSDRYATLPLVEADFHGHIIQPVTASITVPPDSPPDTIPLTLVLSERGEVLEAVPLSGPKQYHAKAVAIAKDWKFKPYWRDGKPIAVRAKGLVVYLSDERAETPRPTPPPVKDPATLQVQVDVTPGWGGRSYRLKLRGDGTVTYIGGFNVAVLGTHCAIVQANAASTVENEIRRTGVYAQPDSYLFDASNVTLSVRYDDNVSFTTSGSAESLWRLEQFFRQAVGADRWLLGNELTAKTLLAEQWVFRRNNETNRNLVDGVLQHGNVAALKDLLALGAPLHRTWNEFQRTRPWRPALVQAALRDDPRFTRLVLGTEIGWDRRTLTSALRIRAGMADLDTMNQLIARGAPRLADEEGDTTLIADREGDTTLIAAARSGVPAVLSRILELKPNVNKANSDGYTALHAAIAPSWRDQIESAFARRDVVIALLLEAGADPHLRTNEGKTALEMAKQEAQPSLISTIEAWIAANPPRKPGP